MPNWTEITLTCEGLTDLPIFTEDENGDKRLDYNTLIPMPEYVRNTISPIRTNAVLNYLFTEYPEDEAREKLAASGLHNADDDILEKSAEEIVKLTDGAESVDVLSDETISAYELGKNYWISHKNTGHWDWYEWAYANWGVKWNACHPYIDGNDTVCFDAPWTYPDKFFRALASKFPEKEFHARMIFEDDWQTAYYINFSNDRWDEWDEPIPDEEEEENA